jgi:hypothetical protein
MMAVCIIIAVESDCLEVCAEGECLREDTVNIERGVGVIGKLEESCLVPVNWVGNMENA